MTHNEFDPHADAPDTSPVVPFDDLMFACTSLCDLLEIENEALAVHDAETVRLLSENKMALARYYERAMEPLVKSPELAETLTPEQREQLTEMGQKMSQLFKINAMQLEAEIESYQAVMDIIARRAKNVAQSTSTYGRDGIVDHPAELSSPMAFNKTL